MFDLHGRFEINGTIELNNTIQLNDAIKSNDTIEINGTIELGDVIEVQVRNKISSFVLAFFFYTHERDSRAVSSRGFCVVEPGSQQQR
jgi:hypothetical protein